MNIPERLLPFIRELESFARSKSMAAFRQEALDRLLGEGQEPGEEDRPLADGYVLFSHRDRSGKKLVDHFLELRRQDLGSDEREVYSRFRDAAFGLFHVEAVRPGEGLRLRRSVTGEVLEVVEVSASRSLTPKMGLFAHVVPYRGHHELGGDSQVVPPETAYLLERQIERLGKKGLEEISDPAIYYRALKGARGAPPRPVNRIEAEVQAAAHFAEIGFPLSVDEVQARFQRLENITGLFKELGPGALKFKDEKVLNRFQSVLNHLWNHTPRVEYQGKTPAEKNKELERLGRRSLPRHLAQDLVSELTHKLRLEDFPDDAGRRSALEEAKERWFAAPQKELEGFSPAELLNSPLPPPPPPEEGALPPPDVPCWSEEDLRGFHSSPSPAARFWALETAIEKRGAFPLDAALSLIDEPSGEYSSQVLDEIRELDDELLRPVLPALQKALEDRLEGLEERDRELHAAAVEALELLREREAALAAGEGDPERIEGLIGKIREAGHSEDGGGAAADALGELMETRDREAIARGMALYLGRLLAEGRRGSEEAGAWWLLYELEGIEIQPEFLEGLYTFLFRGPPGLAQERPEAIRGAIHQLQARSDPAAARRAGSVLTEERKQAIQGLLEGREHPELCRLIAEMAREALGLSRAENPSFAGLAASLEGILDGLAAQENLSRLGPRDQNVLVVLLFGTLFKAIQGRDFEREFPEARGDPAKLLDLIRVDDDWLRFDEDRLREAARLLPPESLLELAESPDRRVRRNALLVLAVQDPERSLDRCLDALSADGEGPGLPWMLAEAAGDALLLPIARRFHLGPSAAGAEVLLEAIQELGTRRAGAFLDHYFASFVRQPPIEIASAVVASGSRERAAAFLSRLRRGGLELEDESEDEDALESLVEEVTILLGLHALPGDARELVEAGVRAYETRVELLEERAQDDEEAVPEREPEALHSGRTEPIRRAEPKVGRNDPCPCGSGKKYKRCCGKGS